MAEAITAEEWLAELARLGVAAGGGNRDVYTAREIAAAVGRGTVWVQGRLRLAIGQGLVEVTTKPAVAISGRPCLVPAYRFLKRPPAGGGKSPGRRRRGAG